MERKTISIARVCEFAGVCQRTIYNWLASGKIEYVRTAGGSVRVVADTLWRDQAGKKPIVVDDRRRLVSIAQAMVLARVSRRTIHTWLARGKIEYVRTVGGLVRIFADTLWHDSNNRAILAQFSIEALRGTLSIAQATKLAGVTRRTIYNWMASGKIEYVRTAGGSVRINNVDALRGSVMRNRTATRQRRQQAQQAQQ